MPLDVFLTRIQKWRFVRIRGENTGINFSKSPKIHRKVAVDINVKCRRENRNICLCACAQKTSKLGNGVFGEVSLALYQSINQSIAAAECDCETVYFQILYRRYSRDVESSVW